MTKDSEYHITLPGDPRSKKNSSRIVKAGNRSMLIPSKPYKEYETACGVPLSVFLLHNADREWPITEPVEVTCTYYMATKRRVDLTNLLEATDDVLQKYGILADDDSDVIVSHDGSRVIKGVGKQNARAEITIRRISNV